MNGHAFGSGAANNPRVLSMLQTGTRYNSAICNDIPLDVIADLTRPPLEGEAHGATCPHASSHMAASPVVKQVFIQGVTRNGRTFRPSDWAERLAGVMSQFRPGGGSARIGSHLAYSPWCVPTVVDGVKVVIVHTDLREAEPMAWDFCMSFAKDNDLQVVEDHALPRPPVQG